MEKTCDNCEFYGTYTESIPAVNAVCCGCKNCDKYCGTVRMPSRVGCEYWKLKKCCKTCLEPKNRNPVGIMKYYETCGCYDSDMFDKMICGNDCCDKWRG